MSQRRKLAAILSTDVVGYSRLMGDDEQATLSTLHAYREIFAQHIVAHEGRVVDSPGDALLAEFPSAVEAVNSAVDIQRELAGRNASLPEHRRMRFRIGVNLGDVTEQDGALYGDGVNIAARLESLADPGGICVSGAVYDQTEGKLPVAFRFAGEQTVKNIAKPVRAYHALLSPGQEHGSGRSPARAMRRVALVILPLLVLVAAVGWYALGLRSPEVPEMEDPALVMPSGPAIAVLPFTNMSGDPGNDYFSDGLTEDIITELSRVRELHVLARNTTFQYKGQAVDVAAVGQKLGVQYMLEGGVRKAEDRVRITAQLIDVTTGAHIWAERYDRQLEDIFALQDEITSRIVGAIAAGSGGRLQESARTRMAARRPENLEAYELLLRASAPPRYDQQWYDEKTALLERAIRLDPNYARARQEYAWHKLVGWILRLDSSLPPEEIKQNAIRALQLDPNDGLAHRTAAFGYLYDRQLDLFEREAQLAFELAPYNADIFAQLGMAIAMSGQWERGIRLVNKAHQLNPVSAAGWYENALHYEYYRKGEYDRALDVLKGHPGQMLCQTQFKYVAVYGQLGEPEKAKRYWDRCVATVADFSPGRVAELLRVWNLPESFIEHYMEGIGKAGYPCRNSECGLRAEDRGTTKVTE